MCSLLAQEIWAQNALSDSIAQTTSPVAMSDTLTQLVAQPDTVASQADSSDKLPVLPGASNADYPLGPKRRQTRQKKSSEITSDIVYTARDSIVMEGTKIALLYGEAQVNYEKMELKADFIRINLDSSTVYATGVPDSLGNMTGLPVFKEGSETFESKAIQYNIKSKKGFIYGTVTQQGEGYVTSQKTKKIGDDVYCLQNGKYTTCDHHDHPHFYLALTKAKMKQGRYIVSGPAYMVVEDIPLPLALPFGYFPINTTYSSGILFPTLGEEQSRGFYAEGLGYYFAINDYLDLAITADIYSKGSWSLALASSYKWRYHFSGSFNFSFVSNVRGTPNTADFSKSNDFRFIWSHRQDPKMSPNTSFSASVNFSTSSYELNNVDSYYNPAEVSQNTKSSTITLTQKFGDSPFTLSASMYVTQRTSDSTIDLRLPDLSLSMSRQYPFKRKKRVGSEKWYEKISVSYNMNLTNSVRATESQFKYTNYLRDWRYGIKHDLPISASFTLFKYLNMSIGLNNNLKWYFKKVDQQWDEAEGTVVRDTTYGFYNIYKGDLSLSMQTQLFGFYTLKSKSGRKMPVFRHKVVPSVSFSFAPDYGTEGWGYWGSYTRPNPNGGYDTFYYDRFSDGVYGGSPSRGASGMLNLSITNNLEMKYWSSKDSTGKAKKVTIIDNLGLSSSYNMFADSLKWSDIRANLRLKIVDQFTLNLDMTFDPYTYQLDDYDRPHKVNVSQIKKNKVLGRVKSASTAFGYTFSNATFKKKNKDNNTKPVQPQEQPQSELEQLLAENDPLSKAGLREKEKAQRKKDDEAYEEFKIPWSLSFNYSVRYEYDYNEFNTKIMEYDRKLTHNLSLSGRINLTKTWAVSVSTYYDITNNKWSYLNCSITKDLHCWQMSASFVPIGRYTTYNFLIGVKSTLLQDLKYEKKSDYSDNVSWY